MVLIQKLGEGLEVPTPGALRRGLGRLANIGLGVQYIHSEDEIWKFAEMCRSALDAWPRDVTSQPITTHRLVVRSTPSMWPEFENDPEPDLLRTLGKLLLFGNEFRAVENGIEGEEDDHRPEEECNSLDRTGAAMVHVELSLAETRMHPDWLDAFIGTGRWHVAGTGFHQHFCVHCESRIFYNEERGGWYYPKVDRHGQPDIEASFKCPDPMMVRDGQVHEPERVVLGLSEREMMNALNVEAEYPAWMRNLANAVVMARQRETGQFLENEIRRIFGQKKFPRYPSEGYFVDEWFLTKRGNGEVFWSEDDDGFTAIQTFYTKKRSSDPRAKSRRGKKTWAPNESVDFPRDLFVNKTGTNALNYPDGCVVNTDGPDIRISCPLLPTMGSGELIEWAENLPVEAHTTDKWTFTADEGPYMNPTVLRRVRERR